MKYVGKATFIFATVALGVMLSQPAFAVVTPVGPDAQSGSFLSLDPFTVTILFGLIIPLVNGIVTKASTPSKVKAIITIVLSAVAALVNVGLTDSGGSLISEQTFKSWALQTVVSVLFYLGVYKPLDVTSTPQPNGQALLANVGRKDS